MWSVVSASVIGTSHERLGIPCQDSNSYFRLSSCNSELLLIALADGAGSASCSHIGSREAVDHILQIVCDSNISPQEITQNHVSKWIKDVINHLHRVAEQKGVDPNELACTLLLGIIGQDEAIFAQIGDGGWVINLNSELTSVTWPYNGEYANITTFITTDAALNTLQFARVTGKIQAIAGFTDGIQNIALNFALKKPHAPFFNPMFDSIMGCEDETSLIAPLTYFLSSEPVISRTDDDKTIVLACRREPIFCSNGVDRQ